MALGLLRANLRDAEDLGLAAYLDAETERQVVTMTSEDAAEAAAAFLAKRTPRFTGR
jgi:2-(1,2-epoxy-1,2-dihydrophenyl)acetyl-CoA isomerase